MEGRGPDYATALLGELLSAISRSLSFSDVEETDIWEWLVDNPVIMGVAPVSDPASDLILRRILEHNTRRPCFATPSMAQLAYEMRPAPPCTDTYLMGSIVL